MKTLMTHLLLVTSFFTLASCNQGKKATSSPAAVVTVQSSAFTNTGAVAFFLQPQLDKIASIFIPAPMAAAAITDLRFCITQMKIVKDGKSTEEGAEEVSLGLVDISNQSAIEWGTINLAEGEKVKEIKFEVHKDPSKCKGVDYSVLYNNGKKLTKDLEFKFKFTKALVANHGDTIKLNFGKIAMALKAAELAGELDDTNIDKHLNTNTEAEGVEL